MHLLPSTRGLFTVAAALLLAAVPRIAAAQEPAPAACPDGRISLVYVDNHAVFDPSDPDLDRRFAWAYRMANRLHVPTREAVIRREILFREGDCYSPDVLLDSERILRSTGFISDADIYGIRQEDGSYHVVVDTEDEWSTRIEPEMDSREGGLAGFQLREDNLLGTGKHVSAFYGRNLGETVYGAAFSTPQLFETQVDAALAVGKTANGYSVEESLAYPFRGEAGRWAFRQRFEHSDRYFEYLARGDEGRVRILYPEQRRAVDVGGVYRLGERGRLTLLGVALAGEWIEYPGGPRLRDTTQQTPGNRRLLIPVGASFDSVSSLRVVFLVGQRNVRFVRRRALDAVRGTEDVRLGVEAEIAVARSMEKFSTDDDLGVDLGLYLAREFPGGIVAGGRVVLEGKRDYEGEEGEWAWSNTFAQVNAWSYWRPSPDSRHTFVAALRGAGGWRVTVPFQTTLGYRSGLRGYRRYAFTGHRRAVLSLEDRIYLGWPLPKLFDLGAVPFVDVGRSWAGGDLYGEDTPLQASAGVGLRLAFPPGSRRTYRLDLAMPLSGGARLGDLRLTAEVGQAIGLGLRDDREVRRSSRRVLSASLFSFPN